MSTHEEIMQVLFEETHPKARRLVVNHLDTELANNEEMDEERLLYPWRVSDKEIARVEEDNPRARGPYRKNRSKTAARKRAQMRARKSLLLDPTG